MDKVKVLIADKDYRVCHTIENILNQHFVSVDVVAQTDSVSDTIDALRRVKPDIAILDIHLLGGTAIEVVKRTQELDYKVMFMSSYQEYTLEDIRFASIDFVYKPLDIDDFIAAVDHVISSLLQEGYKKKIETFFNNADNERGDKQMVLKSSDQIISVPISEIVCGESLYGKSRFHFIKRKAIETNRPLRRYELMLQSYMFYRCHMQFVVNIDHILKVDYAAQVVLMSNGMAVPTDERRFDGLQLMINQKKAIDLSRSEIFKMVR